MPRIDAATRTEVEWMRRDAPAYADRWLKTELYSKQNEFLEKLVRARRVAVVGANSTGKDYVAGRLVSWWLATHYPSKAIILGPTYRQVNDIVWREFRSAYNVAGARLGGVMYDTPRWQASDDHFAIGFATDKAFNIQGFHSPHLLVVITEAHAMRQDHVDAAKRLNPELMVMTGNPFVLMGEFYDAFNQRRDMYDTVQISARDVPGVADDATPIPGLVTLADVEEREREWGVDNPLFLASVLGRFPNSLDDSITTLDLANAAASRDLANGTPSVVAVDVGRFGNDKTVVTHRRGGVARIVWKTQSRDTVEVSEWGHNYIATEGRDATAVVVDDVGVGGGVTDQLRNPKSLFYLRGVKVVAFQGGARADDHERYFNAISEAWLLMGKAFNTSVIDIERDPNLISQVATRQFKIQNDKRLKVQSKEDMRPTERMAQATWSSPDEGDSLAMTFAPEATRVGGGGVVVGEKRGSGFGRG